MGLRDTLKAKADRYGGLKGLAKEALRRASGGGPGKEGPGKEGAGPVAGPGGSPVASPAAASPLVASPAASAPVSPLAPAPVAAPSWVDVGPSTAVRDQHPGTFQVGTTMVGKKVSEGSADRGGEHDDGLVVVW